MMKKSPVTLINEKGERHTFDSSRKACDFLGLKAQSVITEMKRKPKKIVEANGHQWHCDEGKVLRPIHKNPYREKRSNAIIAFKNLGSNDPDHPEKTINFANAAEASRHFGVTPKYIRNQFHRRTDAKDKWVFRRVETTEVRKLLQKIYEDDGIIDLDNDNLWDDDF